MKRANSVITLPLLIVFSTIAIATFSIFLINILKPYIMYEKLLSTSLRYMFIIEEYGYLNNNDKNNLLMDLKNQGFEMQNVLVDATNSKQDYGNPVQLIITYNYNLNLSIFKENTLSIKKRNKIVPMRVIKYGVSKI